MDTSVITAFAAKYIWWMRPEVAARNPFRVIAQVMDIGDYDDVVHLVATLGEDALREALRRAEPGQFNARSWHYWHYRLGVSEFGAVPPLPQRRLA